jgi:predicted phosphodiesterase
MSVRKILIVGDVHGKIGDYFDRLDTFLDRNKHDTADLYSVQIGDFGFEDTYRQRANRFDRSHKYDIDSHKFFGGNHDEYPIPEWAGHLGHFGEVPYVPDSFFVRGAKSIDESARTAGHDWWPEEQLDWKQSKQALDEYIKMEPKHVFSHDAPQVVAGYFFPAKENHPTNTGKLLQEMFDAHQPKTWTFGHWHRTKSMEVGDTLFQCLGELDTAVLQVDVNPNHYEYKQEKMV